MSVYTLPTAYENVEDFPQRELTGKYILIEHRGAENERFLCYEESFKDAYKIYKRVSHKDKSIVLGSVFLTEICGVNIIMNHEEKQLVL